MKFYTYIGLKRNKIYVREFSDNKEHSYSENFQPTMYIQAPPDKCKFRIVNGTQVADIKFDDTGTCRNFIKEHKGVENFPVYGNTNFVVQYISEKYPNKFQWTTQNL